MIIRLISVLAVLSMAMVGPVLADMTRGPVANWVDQSVPDLPDIIAPEYIIGGVGYILLDHQDRVTKGRHETFVRRISKVIERPGLEDVGSLLVPLDPYRETLILHHIHVIRDGEILDMSDKVSFVTIRPERSLENGILDGRLELHGNVPGLEVGDTLDYAWSYDVTPEVFTNT